MDKLEQEKYVRSYMRQVTDLIVTEVQGGLIPDRWQIPELQQHCADMTGNRPAVYMKIDPERRKRYENDKLVHNL